MFYFYYFFIAYLLLHVRFCALGLEIYRYFLLHIGRSHRGLLLCAASLYANSTTPLDSATTQIRSSNLLYPYTHI